MLRQSFNETRKITPSEIIHGNLSSPSVSGTEEEIHVRLSDVSAKTKVFMALKVVDDVGKQSVMSNIVTVPAGKPGSSATPICLSVFLTLVANLLVFTLKY